MEELVQLLPLVGIVVLFWLFIIRPASKRQRATAQMQGSLEVGNEVVLTSGIYGTVIAIGDDRLDVQVAPGTIVQVARGAVGGIVPAAEPDETPDHHTDDTTSARTEDEEG